MKRRSSWIVVFFLLAGGTAFAQAPPDKAKPADPYTIGCLLPLSGKFAATGLKVLDAIIMGFDIYRPDYKSPFKIIIEDTEGSPEKAGAAVTRLVKEHRVIAIIGPLGSAEAQQSAGTAQDLKVPIITLTQKENITDAGDYVFRTFLTARKQMEALVSYAMTDAGMKRFAILYPEDQYGKEMAVLFRSAVEKRKGRIVKSLSYTKGQTDFGGEIKTIAALSVVRKKRGSPQAAQLEDEFRSSINFDALFIPDSLVMLNLLAPQLAYYNVRGIRLLGTSYWNHPTAKKLTGETEDLLPTTALLEGALFADGFSINSYVNEAGRFADSFFAAFDREPGTLEAMAYDAARLSATVIMQKRATSREAFRDSLKNIDDFTGATGHASFRLSRDARKEAFILTIREGQIVPLKAILNAGEK